MGLGKTVEVIGLMLMNPRKAGIKRKREETESDIKANAKPTIKCICHGSDKKKEPKKSLVRCTHCHTSQHVDCVFQGEVQEDDRETYICPFCWKSEDMIIDARTTVRQNIYSRHVKLQNTFPHRSLSLHSRSSLNGKTKSIVTSEINPSRRSCTMESQPAGYRQPRSPNMMQSSLTSTRSPRNFTSPKPLPLIDRCEIIRNSNIRRVL